MSEPNIHVLDFEGTSRTGVVEFGLVTLTAGSIKSTRTELCSPLAFLRDFDIDAHGLNNEVLKGFKPFSAYFEFFNNLRKTGLFGAHYSPADETLLRRTWAYPSASPDFISGRQVVNWGPWIDTCQLYKLIYPDLKNYKLNELIKLFNQKEQLEKIAEINCPKNRKNYHCGLYDAIASAVLLLRLLEVFNLKTFPFAWLVRNSQSLKNSQKDSRQLDFDF